MGETLTADTSGISDTDGLSSVSYSYQWLADDADIVGATDSAYTLVDADAGAVIKVRVSFTDGSGNTESLTSVGTNAVSYAVQQQVANTPAKVSPTIGDTAQVGETLSASVAGIADADGLTNVSYAYQWLDADADIAGATATTYTLTDADAGFAIKVRVSFADDAGNNESLTRAPTDAVATAESGEPPAKLERLRTEAHHVRVVLTWNDPQDGSIAGYVILRRSRATDAAKEFTELVADTGNRAATYTDYDVEAEASYT